MDLQLVKKQNKSKVRIKTGFFIQLFFGISGKIYT